MYEKTLFEEIRLTFVISASKKELASNYQSRISLVQEIKNIV